MRYQGDTASRGSTEMIESKVLAPEKLADVEDLRLNLGCGHIPLDGYVNVDSRELPGVDVLADVRHLPFDPDTVDEIYGAHLLEHFPLDELERVVLPKWRALLRPGGTLRLVVPDSGAMLDEYAAGRFSFDDLRLVTFGDQEYDGDFHFTMFTPESLAELLKVAGFEDVQVLETGRRNGACLEMEVRACKPTRLNPSAASLDAWPTRPVRVALCSGVLFRHDAISHSLRLKLELLAATSRWREATRRHRLRAGHRRTGRRCCRGSRRGGARLSSTLP